MAWQELVAEFRELGGIFENVRIGNGARGRGAFAVDPALPARIFIPDRLTVPVDSVDMRGDSLRVKSGAVEPRAAALFDAYQAHIGWSAGGRDDAWNAQRMWHELPADVIDALSRLGVLDEPAPRFAEASDETAFADYVRNRTFHWDGHNVFVVFVDLVNHLSTAPGFSIAGGVGVAGHFNDEVLARYHDLDSISCFFNYGFADCSVFANSVALTVEMSGHRTLVVNRATGSSTAHGNVRVPVLEERGDTLVLAYMPLGDLSAPDLPRAVFRHLMAPYMEQWQSDEVFEGIARFNRSKFLGLLRLGSKYDSPMARALCETLINQLEALSACVGARRL